MDSSNAAPRYLYKYLSAESFFKVAGDMSFQWSLPTAFNDPFDLQIRIGLGVTDEEARVIIATRLARLALHEEEWILITPSWGGHAENPHLFPDLSCSRELLKQIQPHLAGMNIHEAAAKISEMYGSSVDRFLSAIKVYTGQVTGNLQSGKHYIICFSELHDSIRMWSHYCRGHTGVVVESDTQAKRASQYARSKSVIYQTDVPSFLERRYMRLFMAGDIPQEADRLLFHAVRVKSTAWEYEKEWRCMSAMGTGITKRGHHAYVRLFPDIISGVFVGCKTSKDDRRKIYERTRRVFNNANLWQSQRGAREYRLDFTPVL